MRKATTLLLVVIMLLGAFVPAYGADSTVSYNGRTKLFEFGPGSVYSETDLFDNFKGVMPGDELTEQITIKNNVNKRLRVWMRALGEQQDEGSTEHFLEQMTLTVDQVKTSDRTKNLFDAPANESAQLTDWVYLGTVAPKKSITLNVTLNVSPEMDSDFEFAIGYLDWQFQTEELPDEPDEPPVVPDQPPVEPDVPPVEPPVEPPVVEPPVEPPVEPGPLPQTGQLWWPVALLLLLGIVLTVAGEIKRRKNTSK